MFNEAGEDTPDSTSRSTSTPEGLGDERLAMRPAKVFVQVFDGDGGGGGGGGNDGGLDSRKGPSIAFDRRRGG